jgi:hypothetical protein
VWFYHFPREAAGAASARRSPRPLLGGKFKYDSDASRRGSAKLRLLLFENRTRRNLSRTTAPRHPSSPRNSIVMPGLDPGIHQSSSQVFSNRMDHRVKPGDDDSQLA